jgi:hypothetical protein
VVHIVTTDSPETHDVIRCPADEEHHEDYDRHFQGPVPGPVQEHEAGASETVCNISLTTFYQLLPNRGVVIPRGSEDVHGELVGCDGM